MKCSIKGCDGTARRRGWCGRHYASWIKYADPTTVKLKQYHGLSLKDRFRKYVRKYSSGCWYWTGYRDPNGYGRLNVKNIPVPAHRLSWKLHNGPIPDGMGVLHTCDKPACVRPDHLFLGTQEENNKDMTAKGRCRPGVQRGEKHGMHILTEDQVR